MSTTTLRPGTRLVTTPSGDFATATYRVPVHPDRPLRSVLVVQRGDLPAGLHREPFVHVECTTGDVLADLRCGCGLRLRRTLRQLGQQEHGVLLYLRRDASCSDPRPPAGEDAAVVEQVLALLGREAEA